MDLFKQIKNRDSQKKDEYDHRPIFSVATEKYLIIQVEKRILAPGRKIDIQPTRPSQ